MKTDLLTRKSTPALARCLTLSKTLTCAAVSVMAGSSLYAQSTWSGAGTDNNWSTAANWGGVAPVSDSSTVIQIAGGTRPAPNVDAPFSLKSLTFNSGSGAFTLGGSLLTFAPGANADANILVNSSNAKQTLNNDLKLTQGQMHAGNAGFVFNGDIDIDGATGIRFAVGANGTFTINGVISGTLSSNFVAFTGSSAGTGLIYLNNNNTYQGKTLLWNDKVMVGVDALESGGAFGQGTGEISMGTAGGNASLLTNGAVEIGRAVRILSAGVATVGGATAQTSLYSKDITLGSDSSAANGVTLTAAAGGRVNFSGNLLRATGATGSGDSVTKSGAGIVSVSGTNNIYSGTTTISQGAFLVNGRLAGSGNGLVTLNAGAVLGGAGDGIDTGVIERNVSIDNGGILSAGDMALNGDSLAGTLAFKNSLTLSDTSSVKFDLGTLSDRVVVSGHLTLDGILDVTAGSGFGVGSYKLFDYTGGTLTDNGLQLGTMPSIGNYDYSLDLAQPGAVYLQVVPEPGTAALLLGAGLICWIVRRRG